MSLKEAYERRLDGPYKIPYIGIMVGYISGVTEYLCAPDFLKSLCTKGTLENVAWAEFRYSIPIIDKNIRLATKGEYARYVVGAKIDLHEFQKLLAMNYLNVVVEKDFAEKIKTANSVCIVRPLVDERKLPGQVLVVDENTRVFDTVEELIEASKDFIDTMEEFYSIVRLEYHFESEKYSKRR